MVFIDFLLYADGLDATWFKSSRPHVRRPDSREPCASRDRRASEEQ